MTYQTILVHIDSSAECERRVDLAERVAAALGARLKAVAIVSPLELPQRLRSHPGAKAILQEEHGKSRAAAAALAKSLALRPGAPEARVVEGEPAAALAAAARSADLLVLGQPGPDDLGVLGGHFVESALVDAGRPVLLVPRKGNVATPGRKVLVAWKDAPASARALADARPFLANAESITVLAVNEDGAGGSAAEGVEYLERHRARASPLTVKSDDAGAAIVAHAKKLGADLVVMGAFARPRMREMLLGGATRTVLREMGTCVLMSH